MLAHGPDKAEGGVGGRETMKQKSAVDMKGRIAHFADLKFVEHGHLDTYLPGHERETSAVIGPGVMEDKTHKPAIVTTDGFNVTYARVKPGHGNALHDHPTVEVFIPMDGRWSIKWGEKGENEVILEPWDTISIPPGIARAYKNIGNKTAHIMAILGGTDPGHVIWSKRTLDEAAERGVTIDIDGKVKVTSGS
jgi:quercetin dioxygenase-like cupin family protein